MYLIHMPPSKYLLATYSEGFDINQKYFHEFQLPYIPQMKYYNFVQTELISGYDLIYCRSSPSYILALPYLKKNFAMKIRFIYI